MHTSDLWISRAAGLLVLLVASSLSATTVRVLSIDEQLQRSTAVVEARVVDVAVHATEHRPVTVTRLEVERVLAGDAPARLSLLQLGGTVDGRTTRVHGDAVLEPNTRVVLFVRADSIGTWTLTALAQSAWHIVTSGKEVLVERRLAGLVRVTSGQDGLLEPVHVEDPPRLTLDELRAAIAAAGRDLR